jgi:hypothetical protein
MKMVLKKTLPCKQHYRHKFARRIMGAVEQSCKSVPHRRRIATDTRGDALETLSTEDLDQDPEPEFSVSDEDGGECVAPESVEEIVDETLYQSPMKNRTRSKSRKVVVPEPLIPSYSKDEVFEPLVVDALSCDLTWTHQ